jgi:hypothetical protein
LSGGGLRERHPGAGRGRGSSPAFGVGHYGRALRFSYARECADVNAGTGQYRNRHPGTVRPTTRATGCLLPHSCGGMTRTRRQPPVRRRSRAHRCERSCGPVRRIGRRRRPLARRCTRGKHERPRPRSLVFEPQAVGPSGQRPRRSRRLRPPVCGSGASHWQDPVRSCSRRCNRTAPARTQLRAA